MLNFFHLYFRIFSCKFLATEAFSVRKRKMLKVKKETDRTAALNHFNSIGAFIQTFDWPSYFTMWMKNRSTYFE